ncbi:MAG: sugar ABC transporter permease [Clostridia bacterium]|nr:sugar ABC transporter permease [Clostridia bacterium]
MKSQRKSLSFILKRYGQLYLFLLVPVAYIIIFKYVPMLGVQLAFKNFKYNLGIWGSPWVGFKNFNRFFSSYMFSRVLTNTVRIAVVSLLFQIPFPIIFALLLNSVNAGRYKKVVQTVTYVPHFISTVVVVGILMQIFNPNVGIYGVMYKALTGVKPPDPLANPNTFLPLYVGSNVWKTFGWNSIVYLAALTNVSPELYEAAEIDGATRLQRVFYVEIPSIVPIFVINLILSCGKIMNVGFQQVYLMQNDLNLRVSEVISTYVYKQGLGNGSKSDYAYSTAVDLFNSVINLALVISVNRISKKVSETSLW